MGNSQAQGNYSTAMGSGVTQGDYSTAIGYEVVAGGRGSTAMGYQTQANRDYSTAMGYNAIASFGGSFVWADASSGGTFSDTAANQFCIRAVGGVQLDASTSLYCGRGMQLAPSTGLYCGQQTRQMLNLWGTGYGIGVQTATEYFRSDHAFAWYIGGSHSDTTYDGGGGTVMMQLDPSGLYVRGTFVSTSDRNAKENFKTVDPREVLEKVAAMPVSRWNYKQDTSSQHIGPMAQDFYAAFNVGPDDKHITTVDEGGVAFAAIQGLNQKLEQQGREKNTEIQSLRMQNAELTERLSELEKTVKLLAKLK
jgi:hypothetical protein